MKHLLSPKMLLISGVQLLLGLAAPAADEKKLNHPQPRELPRSSEISEAVSG
jgi:hypothetical protein